MLGHADNIPTMQFFDWNFQKYSFKLLFMLSVTYYVCLVFELMHCGIILNMFYWFGIMKVLD